ncbi:UBA domain-containing protein 3 [Escovopsis weberi]|uniref:UBA domain-containing protein 3 n=1 Tax=Escovopsis weberi TaxID=150374 RepID=A0A0M8N654_ESCWE|nr:UBA domain-containing protein 3 [Escovopsis weberi]
MAGSLSKRQQARNESVLQDMVQSVPGNNLCADCYARNPSWASWSLGVFLCMRCAAIHRKLGTHISKVKSLTLDAWTNEQVDNMRKVGNVVSNKTYNPENKKPPIPVDSDEADSAMERFIRQKYIITTSAQSGKKKAFVDEDTPPPLPPKNSKFGFRSASSIFPLSSKSKKEAKQAAHETMTLSSKQSRVFGATVDRGGGGGDDDTDRKLARLRDMGFPDEHRNDMILRGVNGNLERAVEALIRLGEGDRSSPAPASGASSAADKGLRSSRSLTPVNSGSAAFGAGLVIPGNPALDRPVSASTPSTNPFDMAPPAPAQTAFSTGAMQNNNPYLSSTNPFGLSPQPTGFANQSFQNLSMPPTQPLFPHHTGGVASQASQFSRFLSPTSSTPSFTSSFQGAGLQSSMTYPQPGPQPMMPQQTGYNPFFTQQQQQQQQAPLQAQSQKQQQMMMMMPPNLSQTQQAQPASANNPFQRSPARIASPPLTQIPEQSQPHMFQMAQQLQPQHTSTNPFYNNPMQQQQQQQPVQSVNAQAFDQQQQQFWQPKRQDKASILALYNQPPRAMHPSAASSGAGFPGQAPPGPEDGAAAAGQGMMDAPGPAQQSRSISQPMPGGTNPFMKNGPPSRAAADVFATDRKTSRESMNLGMDMAWTNGRHSPDAFASLSARHV